MSNLGKVLNVYRNLNKAGHVYSMAEGTAGNPGKVLKDCYIGEGPACSGSYVILENVSTCYSRGGINKLTSPKYQTRKDGKLRRTVYAFLRGTVQWVGVDMPSAARLMSTSGCRPVTINPERGELRFVWADDRTPCPERLAFVIVGSAGCFAREV